jgi:hypothetical protein
MAVIMAVIIAVIMAVIIAVIMAVIIAVIMSVIMATIIAPPQGGIIGIANITTTIIAPRIVLM